MTSRARINAMATRTLAWLAAACVVMAPIAAGARCIESGVLYSCTTVQGGHVQLSCYGVGTIQTCIANTGQSVLVGPHWRTDLSAGVSTQGSSSAPTPTTDISFESQLSSAIAANPAFGVVNASPTQPGSQ